MLAHWTYRPWLPCGYLGRCGGGGLVTGLGLGGVPQEDAALREFRLPHPVGQEAEVPQPVEATRWDVEHQPPQEFDGVQGQRAQTMAALVILVAKGYPAVLEGYKAVVGDGHAMGVAGQVGEDVLGGLEGLFGVDAPLLVT